MVRFDLDGLDVFFPYDYMYPEQYNYMLNLKRAIDAKGHCLLEMPTGTGKTVCLISLITSYQFAHPEVGKLIYCTRTVPEMVKCVEEVKKVINYRESLIGPEGAKVLAVCLSSRRNLCINRRVMEESDREAVDSACRSITASWVRKKAASDASVELCEFYEGYDKTGTDAVIANGIYSLDDLKKFGDERGWCPYFLARHVINHANILIYNYQYVLDPKVAGLVSKELEAESIVVFDEAHNIDNVCIEALSVQLDERSLASATRSLGRISSEVTKMKNSDARKLQEEYQRLVRGLAESGVINNADSPDAQLANPALPDDILQEAVPGNIRRAEHFISFMKKIVEHLKHLLNVDSVEMHTPLAFIQKMQQRTALEVKPLRFAYSRLNSLLRTLEVTNLEEFNPLQDVADFITLVATYTDGFAVITEPEGSIIPGLFQPVLQLACLDASLAIKPVFERFSSVVITSGTLSPLDLYPRLLKFTPVIQASMDMSMFRTSICPLVVTKGSGSQIITTRFEKRDDASIIRNYGELLVDVASNVPDGIVCFFTSYQYMESIVQKWEEMGILRELLEKKLIFIETKDVVETTLALDNFRRACDSGRGAVFLSIARGKVAEGIDFDRHYGRAVLLFGVPFQYTKSPVISERLMYLRTHFQIKEGDFLTFDAMRQAAQCVGRVIRSKMDYGLMIFADSRYNRHDKRTKLPSWILKCLPGENLDLPTSSALDKVKRFLKEMAQPVDPKQLHDMLLSEVQLRDKRHAGVDSKAPVVDEGIDIQDAPKKEVNAVPMELERGDIVRKEMEEHDKAKAAQEQAMEVENGAPGESQEEESAPSEPQSKRRKGEGGQEEEKRNGPA